MGAGDRTTIGGYHLPIDLPIAAARTRGAQTMPRPAIFQMLDDLTAAAGRQGVLIVETSVGNQNLDVLVGFAISGHQNRFDDLTAAGQLARDYAGPAQAGWDWLYDRRWRLLPWWLGVVIRPHAPRFSTCIPVSDLPTVIQRLTLGSRG